MKKLKISQDINQNELYNYRVKDNQIIHNFDIKWKIKELKSCLPHSFQRILHF